MYILTRVVKRGFQLDKNKNLMRCALSVQQLLGSVFGRTFANKFLNGNIIGKFKVLFNQSV